MTIKSLVLGTLIAFNLTPVLAQGSNAINLSGTVSRIDDTSVAITIDSGAVESYALSPKLVILQTKPASLTDIKPNDFVASAAVPHDDGKLHSTELRIFPEALRGLGEGQRPMGKPNTMMTNAAVSEVIAAPKGRVIKVRYKDGTSELVVGPEVPITALVVSDAK